MAVVVKSGRITKETAENATAKHDIIKIKILPPSPIQQCHAVEKGTQCTLVLLIYFPLQFGKDTTFVFFLLKIGIEQHTQCSPTTYGDKFE